MLRLSKLKPATSSFGGKENFTGHTALFPRYILCKMQKQKTHKEVAWKLCMPLVMDSTATSGPSAPIVHCRLIVVCVYARRRRYAAAATTVAIVVVAVVILVATAIVILDAAVIVIIVVIVVIPIVPTTVAAAATATIALPLNITISVVVAAHVCCQRGASPAITIAVAIVEHTRRQRGASPAIAVVTCACCYRGRGPEG